MNAPAEIQRYPVPGQPFEPYCRFGLCERDEPHTAECRTHEQPEPAEEEFPLPY